MQSNDNKNAILAVVISGLVLFGWNYFFPAEVYQPVQETKVSDKTTLEEVKQSAATNSESAPNSIASEEVTLKNNNVVVTINSFLNITSFQSYNSQKLLNEIFNKHDNSLILKVDNSSISPSFSFTKISDSSYSFNDSTKKFNGSVDLSKNGILSFKILSNQNFIPMISFASETQSMDDEQKFNSFALNSDGLDVYKVSNDEKEYFEGKYKWFGLDFNYHLFSYLLNNELFKIEINNSTMNATLINPVNSFEFGMTFVKKNYDDLKEIGYGLSNSVDFGIWGLIAVPILRGLQYFFSIFQNYGLAIIFLTIVIRLLTFPLQYKSFKSMKKMQVIQPELQKIKEKYKDNPQKVQQETMALFKKAGANPLGGCLPMILQMPVFFAFYKVLFTSVELVDAPFYFWIHDLSEKDPFYILPILMGIAMFLNMKLTPSTTMDPAQQKVMMFMPIMFSLFMINLPSGLTLYMLVSTIAGMLQQLFVYKKTT